MSRSAARAITFLALDVSIPGTCIWLMLTKADLRWLAQIGIDIAVLQA